MASFTDNPQALTNFNPYVSQLPVEAMVKVGMQKQQQYDEGIQKIQTNIDNIAGLDVSRDVDKAYLQSKINQLGSDTRIFAMSDFSNAQLVNSVNGMTNSIIKDPNVQNAVASTARIRKEQTFMEEERKKGTLHKNNELYFNDSLNSYLSSDKIGESFNGKYQTYTDYQKKWRDIKKDLDIKEDTTDLPFLMDKAGRYIDAKGNVLPPGAKPIPNDYMIKETFKGIDPQRLKQAVMSAMDDNDYAQMKIDAYVKYRGYTPEMLADVAKERFDENEKSLVKTIDSLNILKSQNSGNQNLIDAINKQLSAATSRLESDKSEFDDSLKDLYENPEQFKNKIFAMDSINQFANSFSNISHIQQIVDSPIKKQMNEDRKYNLDVIKFQTDNAHWDKTYKLSIRKQMLEENKADFASKVELYKLGLGPNPLGPQAGKYEGAPSTDPEVLDGIVESFQQEASITQLQKDQNVLKGQWAKNQAPGTKDLEAKFLSDLNDYRSNPNKKINPGARKIFEEYDKLDKLQKLKINTINDVRKEVDNSFKGAEDAITSKLQKETGLKVILNGKPTGTFYSAKDIYNINRNVSKYINVGKTYNTPQGMPISEPTTFDDAGAARNLSERDYQFYKKYKNKYLGKGDSFTLQFQKKAIELKGKYESEYNSILKAKDDAFLVTLKDRINSIVPVTQQLPAGSASKFTALVENKFAREQKGQTEEAAGFVKGEDFDLDTTRNLMLNKQTIPTYTTYGDDVYVTLTGKIKDKAVVQKFKVSKDEFSNSFPGVIVNDVDIDFVKSSAANGSTNYKYHVQASAEDNPNDAFQTANYSNGNTKKYIVKGDVFFDPNNKNLTVPIIYVKNVKTGNVIAISSDTFNTFTNSQASIGQMNDLIIDNYLKNNNIDANF